MVASPCGVPLLSQLPSNDLMRWKAAVAASLLRAGFSAAIAQTGSRSAIAAGIQCFLIVLSRGAALRKQALRSFRPVNEGKTWESTRRLNFIWGLRRALGVRQVPAEEQMPALAPGSWRTLDCVARTPSSAPTRLEDGP